MFQPRGASPFQKVAGAGDSGSAEERLCRIFRAYHSPLTTSGSLDMAISSNPLRSMRGAPLRISALLLTMTMLCIASGEAFARGNAIATIDSVAQRQNRRAMLDTGALRSKLRIPSEELKRVTSTTVRAVYAVNRKGEGKVISISAQGKSFENAVRAALRGVRSTAAMRYGKPVADTMILMVSFYIDDEENGAAREEIGIGITYRNSIARIPPQGIEGKAARRTVPGPDDHVDVTSVPMYDVNLFRALVQYPEIARRNGIEGSVIVRVLVCPDGRVCRLNIVRSDNKIFDRAAFEAIHQMTFTPAMQGEEPVHYWVTIPVEFRLDRIPKQK